MSDTNRQYSFDERLLFSNGVCESRSVSSILLAEIPGATGVRKATVGQDRSGTDWWVDRECDKPLSIDAKVRSKDYAFGSRPKDDLALETWSKIECGSIGWTRNPKKQTDYILWLWTDSGRWCIIPFPLLCAVMQQNWEKWRSVYGSKRQETTNQSGRILWTSECVFVPRREIWKEIYCRFSGVPALHNQERRTGDVVVTR